MTTTPGTSSKSTRILSFFLKYSLVLKNTPEAISIRPRFISKYLGGCRKIPPCAYYKSLLLYQSIYLVSCFIHCCLYRFLSQYCLCCLRIYNIFHVTPFRCYGTGFTRLKSISKNL